MRLPLLVDSLKHIPYFFLKTVAGIQLKTKEWPQSVWLVVRLGASAKLFGIQFEEKKGDAQVFS